VKLKTEEILKRDDGSRVRIVVELYTPSFGEAEYRFHVQTCAKGKRTWKGVVDNNSYAYRCLTMEKRRELKIAEYMKVISDAELLNAKMKMWESFKPEI
jgi:hypothetical protein